MPRCPSLSLFRHLATHSCGAALLAQPTSALPLPLLGQRRELPGEASGQDSGGADAPDRQLHSFPWGRSQVQPSRPGVRKKLVPDDALSKEHQNMVEDDRTEFFKVMLKYASVLRPRSSHRGNLRI